MIEKARAHVGLRVRPDDLKRFSIKALMASGLSEHHATETAEVLVTTDAWGTFTHGTRQMLPLLDNVRKGGLDADAEPAIIAQGPSWALVDGHFAMPMVTSQLAMNTAIEKARASGIAYAGVRHSGHFGAGGFYAVMAAEKGMIGLCVGNVDVRMTVPGARSAVIGTNPLAYAVPTANERPVFMDIATSVVAISKVLTAKVAGTPIPDNWLVDENGRPTSDPSGYPETGAIVPMAGHKGYGIALLIEILAGVLTGAAFLSGVGNWLAEDPQPADQGHAFIALNIDALMALDQFKDRMDAMISELRDAPKAEGSDRIYLPGEMEWDRYKQAYSEGLQLPDFVLVNLFTIADRTGLTDDLEAIFQKA